MEKTPYDKKVQISTPMKAAGAFTTSMLVVVIAYFCMGIITAAYGTEKLDGSVVYFFARYFVISLSLIIGCLITYKRQKLLLSDVTEVKFDAKYIIVILLVAGGALFGLSGLNDYFVAFLQKFGYVPDMVTLPEKNLLNVILCVVFIAIFPAVTEEFLFRGLVLKGSLSLGNIPAILISAAAFSLYHTSPSQTIYQFAIGVIYAVIAITSDSVIPTTVIHFLNNFIIIVFNYYLPDFSLMGGVKIVSVVLGVLCVAIGLYISLKGVKFSSENKKKDKADVLEYFLTVAPGFLVCIVLWVANLFA